MLEQKERLCPKSRICENDLEFLRLKTAQYRRAVEQEQYKLPEYKKNRFWLVTRRKTGMTLSFF